jgi:hypothetical protein
MKPRWQPATKSHFETLSAVLAGDPQERDLAELRRDVLNRRDRCRARGTLSAVL